ncbi:ArsR/SmtB family transcription factor [Streptomyces sp. NPDC059718]
MNARTNVSPAHGAHPREPRAQQYIRGAEILSLLADRTRLTLLHRLTEGEADVTTLTEQSGAARPAVSQHLAKLRLAGLVSVRKEGRHMIYGLPDAHLGRLVEEVLSLADHHLKAKPPHN